MNKVGNPQSQNLETSILLIKLELITACTPILLQHLKANHKLNSVVASWFDLLNGLNNDSNLTETEDDPSFVETLNQFAKQINSVPQLGPPRSESTPTPNIADSFGFS